MTVRELRAEIRRLERDLDRYGTRSAEWAARVRERIVELEARLKEAEK